MLARVQPGLLSILRSALHSSFKSTSATTEYQPRLHSVASTSTEPEASPDTASVLENPSEEYLSVLRDTFVPHPTTQDLIKSQLPPSLPSPTPNDTSIFEDNHDADYLSISAGRDYSPRSLLQTFGQLITAEKYDEAYDLMLEIRSAGIDIPPSHLFELPAQVALTHPSPSHSSLESRTSRFISWLQLLPSSKLADIPRRFRRSRMLVFRTPQTNLPLAIQFSILLASKGYYALIVRDAMPFVMTYAPPAISLQFIKDFEEAATSYHINHSASRRPTRRVKTLVRGPAIIALARANHTKQAISLLPKQDNSDFRLPVGVYKYLYFCLYGVREPEGLSDMARIRRLLRDPTTSSPFGSQLARHNSTLSLGDEVMNGDYVGVKTLEIRALMAEIHPESDRYIGEPLATELNDLITAVQSPILPPIVRLTSFIRDYMNNSRSSAIVHLRRLAFNSDSLCGSWFLQAEMTYYLSEDLPIPVLLSFVNQYFFSGVPKEEILNRLDRFAEARANNDIRHDHPAYAATGMKSTRRIPPHHSHMSLVWQALIKLTPSDEGIEELYRLFIHLASLNADKTSTDLSFLRSPYLRNAIVGPVIFTPFIERFLASKQPERFPDIMRDMMKFNIVPTIHHFTQMGRFYANKGDIERTFSLMDALEKHYPITLPVPMTNPRPPGWKKGEELPRPDVTFYASILRGLVKSKQLTAALKVVRQFKQRYVYIRGQDQLLDDALDDLQNLMPKAEKPVKAVGQQRLAERFK